MDNEPVALGVDVGGTFTDVVLLSDGEVTTTKVPTTGDQSEGVLDGIEVACESAGIDPDDVEQFRHGMTVATNALLEGEGAQTALVTTAGFADVLAIGRQDRPALYDLNADAPEPLVPAERRYEIAERATPEGIETPVEDDLDSLVEQLDPDTESIAISLLHAYAHEANEQAVASTLRERTDLPVVASHETLPEFREYERTATTVADAYVTPVIRAYLDTLVAESKARGMDPPRVMQSNGGIATAETLREHAVTTALSGPAAGVVGAAQFEPDSHDGIITFDMGGTSTDVSLVREGDIERTTDGTVGEYPIHVPMVDVETVGAGGGSIAWVDAGGALRVGPESAGATPGPVCYGKGGDDPTVTDAAVVLGYLGPATTLGDDLSLDAGAARDALAGLATDAELSGPVEAAQGVHRVANATMTRAIRRVTLERGHDPRSFALVAFGGAGPMHAATLARRLGVETVRVPKANGVLSALGLLAADERHDASRTVRTALADADRDHIETEFAELREAALDATATDGADGSTSDDIEVSRQADLRYAGQSYELTVDVPAEFDSQVLERRFHETHERIRGYRLDDERVDVLTLRVTVTMPGDPPPITHEGTAEEPASHRDAWFDGDFKETPVYDRTELPAEAGIGGPAICEGGESTVVVPPDWRCSVDARGTLVLEAKA